MTENLGFFNLSFEEKQKIRESGVAQYFANSCAVSLSVRDDPGIESWISVSGDVYSLSGKNGFVIRYGIFELIGICHGNRIIWNFDNCSFELANLDWIDRGTKRLIGEALNGR